MPAPAIRFDGAAVDLASRNYHSTAIVGSPALAAETIVCTLTIAGNVAVQKAIYLWASVAFTVGTSGTGATLKIRQTDVNGSTLYSTGAQTVVATNLWETAGQAVDTAPTVPGQVYVVTLQITGGAAISTVSAASLIATVV